MLPTPHRDGPAAPGRDRRRRRRARLLTSAVLLVLTSCLLWLVTRFDPLGRARAAYDRHDLNAALRAARAYLDRWPGDRRASLLAARCLTRLGRARDAEGHYRNAGRLGLDDLHIRAYSLARANEPGLAARAYRELLDGWPDDPLALRRLAAISIGLGRWEEVLEIGERLATIPAERVAGLTLSGLAHHELKHPRPTVEAFEQVLHLDPELKAMPVPPTRFWGDLALALMAIGDSPRARRHLQNALGRRDDASLMELLGMTYHQEGEVNQAERCWRRAMEWDPNNADVHLDLGRLALHRGRADEAVRLLSRAAELSPRSGEPSYNLAQAYQLLGRTEEAEKHRRIAQQGRAAKSPGGGMGEPPAPPRPDPAAEAGDGVR